MRKSAWFTESRPSLVALSLLAMVLPPFTVIAVAGKTPPEWTGNESCRILIMVPPVDIGARLHDDTPAEVRLDLDRILASAGCAARADLSTLRIVRYNPKTGKPMRYDDYLYGQTEYDRPIQWYDDAIPDPFPDRDRSMQSPWIYRAHWGSYYDVIGDWRSGRLAWSHTQDGAEPSYYAVYFSLLADDKKQTMPPPRGWIGDGSKRSAPIGSQSTGIYHVDCQMIDFNEDGLLDLVCGSSRGGILWYENLGSRQEPKYSVARMLFYADGKPIDPGFVSTPTAVDWDCDGRLDLLVGAKGGWAYYYRNVGTNLAPRYEDRGPIKSDGAAIRVPASPVPEVAGPNGEAIYKEDYEPFIEVTDWDGDGDADLLIGGYVTGRVFWYENVGRNAEGTPQLQFNGHLTADGKPLDVGWAANPAAADVDGDGDLDLIVGDWRKWGNEIPPEVAEDFLAYFENIGTRTSPALTMKPLARIGRFPEEIIASPTLADWDGDGDLDLAVSTCSGAFYLFKNVGDAKRPKFDTRRFAPLQMPWGNDPLPYATDLLDWNGDSTLDLIQGHSIGLSLTNRLPWKFGAFESILPKEQVIDHRAWRGDDWAFTAAVDFDQDSKKDILFGDYWGNVWLHRNVSSKSEVSFDAAGVLIKTKQGQPLQVGRTSPGTYDFDSMQGPRTSFVAADFDGDGSVDLVLNDVFGHYYFCRRGAHGREPVVESQILFAEIKTYATNCVLDWDGDGRLDLLVSQLQNHLLFRNEGKGGSETPFGKPEKLDLPLVPVIGSVVRVFAADVNRDGDRDVIISSDHGYDCFFERSFLTNGYAKAEYVKLERGIP